ncbi:MAG: hypothetical protein FWC21_04340 [Treponema sp.]|nr:hypothetical protein [Treponema sp.]
MKKYLMLSGVIFIMCACTTPEAALSVKMQGSSSQSLIFESCKAVSENEIEFVFSKGVTVKSASLLPDIPIESIENGSTVRIKLSEAAQPGSLITADILAEDENRNTINALVSFRAKNSRMPNLVINEVCTENSNPRTEFIEFLMLSEGNLGGMRVVIMGNTNASKLTTYEFQPIEVKKDEFVVLHLRMVEDASVSEYGESLNESGGRNASPLARDIWIQGNSKLVHKEATIIYALDQDDKILAALMISNSADNWWSKDYHAQAASFLFNQGFWVSASGNASGPVNAARSAGTTNTRTINRDETAENPNLSSSWYVTVTSGATAGRSNNTGRYSN